MHMIPFEVTKENYEEQVVKAQLPVLLDFWAPWCGYCRRIAPALSQIADELDGALTVGKVNIDEQPELASQFGVETIPTLQLMKSGAAGATLIAPQAKDEILDWLAQQSVTA